MLARPALVAVAAMLVACRSPSVPPSVPPPQSASAPPRRPLPGCGAQCPQWSALLLSGGRDREDNVVAHERNVAYASRSLAALGVAVGDQTVLFADGPDPAPDVQQEEPDPERRALLWAIGLARGPGEEADAAILRYRDHDVPGARRADRASVLATLAADAAAAARGPDLFFYVTDHGLEQPDRTNNLIVLWGKEDLSVRALGEALDAQPPARRVVTVMAQCFSGSFAALVHEGGNPTRPLAAHDRCGFFAAPADRPAAGCSPKSDEALYDDYSTRFFAALSGVERGGGRAPPADFDGDGRVSFEEAHLAAVVLERTQDVPVSSSEELLRRARPVWADAAARDERPVREIFARARPTLRGAARALLASIGDDGGASIARLREIARAPRSTAATESAEERERRARLGAHLALRREAGATAIPEGPAGLALVVLGHARVAAWAAGARAELAELEAAESAGERLRAAIEEREARHLRLARLAELVLLEERAEREDPRFARDLARVRACETSGF